MAVVLTDSSALACCAQLGVFYHPEIEVTVNPVAGIYTRHQQVTEGVSLPSVNGLNRLGRPLNDVACEVQIVAVA